MVGWLQFFNNFFKVQLKSTKCKTVYWLWIDSKNRVLFPLKPLPRQPRTVLRRFYADFTQTIPCVRCCVRLWVLEPIERVGIDSMTFNGVPCSQQWIQTTFRGSCGCCRKFFQTLAFLFTSWRSWSEYVVAILSQGKVSTIKKNFEF